MSRPENHSPVLVRFAAIEEASEIAHVLREAFAEYESLYTPEGFAATTPTADRIQRRWSEGPVWVAIQEDRVVGTVAAAPRGDALYVRSMALLPATRGRGVGRSLLEQVELFAHAHGFRRLLLSTTPFLDGAIRLYERFGFERTDDGPHELWGTPLFTMERRLPPTGELEG